jgi:hypothetical protein
MESSSSSITIQHVQAVQPVKTVTVINAVQTSERCACYNKDSTDSRCCGFCYYFCASHDPDDSKKEVCLNDCTQHCLSQYIYTDDILCKSAQGVTCLICFPFKCFLFLPCLLGAGVNTCINDARHTKLNYLF